MNAVTLDSLETQPGLRDDLPAPTLADNELLVRVHSSSVNPVDNAIAAGMLSGMAEHTFPVILGRDYAGLVDQVGANVTRYAPGDQVYGFVLHANPDVHAGSWAELIAVPEDTSVANPRRGRRRPAGAARWPASPRSRPSTRSSCPPETRCSSSARAAASAASPSSSRPRAGATVIAPALTQDEPYLRDLGVTDVLPRDGDLVADVRGRYPDGVDALLDLVSYTPGSYDATLKTAARIVSPPAPGEGEAARTSWQSPAPRTCSGSAPCSPTGRSASLSKRPTCWRKHRKRSRREPPRTARARSQSRSAEPASSHAYARLGVAGSTYRGGVRLAVRPLLSADD